jgi:hypothetical protein
MKSYNGILSPLKFLHSRLGLNSRTLGPVASTLPLDYRGRQFILHFDCMIYDLHSTINALMLNSMLLNTEYSVVIPGTVFLAVYERDTRFALVKGVQTCAAG